MATHITYAEAASRLSINVRTVSRMVARGDLDIIGQGNGRRVSIASVEEMLRPHGVSRAAARICTPQEVEETERFLEGLLAKARAERAAMVKTPSAAAVVISAGAASARD